MKYFLTILLSCFLALPVCGQNPNAEQLMQGAKMLAALQQSDLEGFMSKKGLKVPVALFMRKNNIQFQVSDGKAWSIFHMQMNDKECKLLEMIDGKQKEFPAKRLAEPIMGMDLTYEDLALRFFYWKNPKLEGEENVGIHGCYKIRLDNPGVEGAYKVIYVWVHKKFGAFMKIEGFDKNGKPLKRFEVTDVMKIGKDQAGNAIYTLKQMNVCTLQPENGRVASETKLLFQEPK